MESTKKILGKNDELAEKIEVAKNRESDKQKIIRVASLELLQNCNLVKERGSIAKLIIRGVSSNLVEYYQQIKGCPLLTNPTWDCNFLNSIDLEKGKEKYCHSGEFLSCPSFDYYFLYKLAEIHIKMKLKMKNKKDQKQNTK